MRHLYLVATALVLLCCLFLPAGTAAARATNAPPDAPGRQDYAVPNRMVSSTGATLHAYGECGSAQSALHLLNGGFEYFRLVVGPVTMEDGRQDWVWGEWTEIGQRQRFTLPLPSEYLGVQYWVQGADRTARGWETHWARTSFTNLASMLLQDWC